MTPPCPGKSQPRERCSLRPELAACFAVDGAAPNEPRPVIPARGVLAELARYGRP